MPDPEATEKELLQDIAKTLRGMRADKKPEPPEGLVSLKEPEREESK